MELAIASSGAVIGICVRLPFALTRGDVEWSIDGSAPETDVKLG